MNNKYTQTMSLILAAAVAPWGCATGEEGVDSVEERNAEIISNLLEAGFAEEDIEVRETPVVGDSLTLGDTEEGVFIDDDVQITLESSLELLGDEDDEDGTSFRHWRTPSRVTNNRTICLIRITSAAAAYSQTVLPQRMRTAVGRAKNNYNALNSFNLTFKVGNGRVNAAGNVTHSVTGCDFATVVYRQVGPAGGQAGFPSGGAPFSQIILRSGLMAFDDAVLEHVVTHEIGHTIGLRHTDWRTRSSCGGPNVNEGRQGAVRIPNTANQTTNSVMASCFSDDETGNFRGEDAEALRKIY